jgi:nucleoside permease NupC
LRDAADLARKEFALLKAEMAANVRTLGMAIGMMIGAAVLAILSLIWLTQALVEWLATVVDSQSLAALIVGGVLAAAAVGLGLYGRSILSASSLTPDRSIESLRRDSEVLSESVSR